MKINKNAGAMLILSVVLSGMPCRMHAKSGEYKFGQLTELAGKYNTDKGMHWHGFSEAYEHFFSPGKDSVRKLFEIGVLDGASLRMFADFFPKAKIYGIDIESKYLFNTDRIKTFLADQGDRKKLQEFIGKFGGDFDIILDDGGHMMNLQQISFGFLFRYLKPGGYYVIEDIHTSLLPKESFGAEADGSNTTLTMIIRFITTGTAQSGYMTDDEMKYLTENIAYMNLFSRNKGQSITCIVKKR